MLLALWAREEEGREDAGSEDIPETGQARHTPQDPCIWGELSGVGWLFTQMALINTAQKPS